MSFHLGISGVVIWHNLHIVYQGSTLSSFCYLSYLAFSRIFMIVSPAINSPGEAGNEAWIFHVYQTRNNGWVFLNSSASYFNEL